MSETDPPAPPARGAAVVGEAADRPRQPPRSTRVVVVDDQEDFLAWVCGELERAGSFQVVGRSLRPEQALATVQETSPDLLLVDFDMPGMNGIEVIRQVRQQAPSVRVVLMSLNDNRVFDVLARTAGAIGFLPKQRVSQEEIRLLLDESAG